MTVRETLIEIVRNEGYDLFKACEIVDGAMSRLKVGKNVLSIGKVEVTITKEGKK